MINMLSVMYPLRAVVFSVLPSCFLLCGSDEEKAKQGPAYHLNSTNLETRETLAELYKEYKGDQLLASTMKEPEAKKTDKLNAVSKAVPRIFILFYYKIWLFMQ